MGLPSPSIGGAQRAQQLVDVVDTWDDARRLATPPLIVREGLRALLGSDALPEVGRIDAGHSNATFFVTTESSRCILRRPPRPPFEPGAHDVLREYRFLAALRTHAVRIPAPLLACRDIEVIGAPFYLMEALDGVVVGDRPPEQLDRAQHRRQFGSELVEAIVELQAVDPGALGLGDPAAGRGYLGRQLRLWGEQWSRNRTRPVPALEEVAAYLRSGIPATDRVTIVHGDYKLDNVLFCPRAPVRLLAILDWEMATLGDPLADIGYLTATWNDPGESPDRLNGLSSVTVMPGFSSRRELADLYGQRTGADLARLQWYQALALWKLAILLEASYRRFLAGTTSDEFLGSLEGGVPKIAAAAAEAAAGALV